MTNDEYIGYVELGKALCHEGVKGMAWGVRNGPPYPLNYEGKASLNSNKKVLGSSSNSRHYGVNAKVGKFVQKASTDRAALNRKLAENKLKGQEDKVKLSNARHVTKATKQSNKTNEQMKKLEDKQAIEKQKAALKDARHRGSTEFRLRQDSLLRAQYKTEMAKQKMEQQRLKEAANKDKYARAAAKDREKAARHEAKERLNNQIKMEREKAKTQLKLEKEKAKQEEKARNQEAKLANKAMKIAAKQEERQQKAEQKAQEKAEARANTTLVVPGSKQLLNRNTIINSGDPKMLQKYGKYLNNDEYKLAAQRIQQVHDLKSAKFQNFINKGRQIADGAQNVANFTKNAVDTYNNVAKAINSLGGKNLKIISDKPASKDYTKLLESEKAKQIYENLKNSPSSYKNALMDQYLGIKNVQVKGADNVKKTADHANTTPKVKEATTKETKAYKPSEELKEFSRNLSERRGGSPTNTSYKNPSVLNNAMRNAKKFNDSQDKALANILAEASKQSSKRGAETANDVLKFGRRYV